MFVVSKRNVIVPSADGSAAFPLPKGFVGPVPRWVAETAYFKALVEDGKVGVTESTGDAEVERQLEKKPVRRKTGKE